MDKIDEYLEKAEEGDFWKRENLWKEDIAKKAIDILDLNSEIWVNTSQASNNDLYSRIIAILEKDISDKLLETYRQFTYAEDIKKMDISERDALCNAVRFIFKMWPENGHGSKDIRKATVDLYNANVPYAVYAYIMFVYDKTSFAPLRPEAVRTALKELELYSELKDIKLDKKDSFYTYDLYVAYNKFIKEKIAPRLGDSRNNILDGYNFLWIVRTMALRKKGGKQSHMRGD